MKCFLNESVSLPWFWAKQINFAIKIKKYIKTFIALELEGNSKFEFKKNIFKNNVLYY